jgi:hypothetical protein
MGVLVQYVIEKIYLVNFSAIINFVIIFIVQQNCHVLFLTGPTGVHLMLQDLDSVTE